MKLARLSILILVSALTFTAIGCSSDAAREDDKAQPAQTAKEVEKADGSMLAVSTANDGTKTEVRTFKTGEVAKVTRTTAPGGKRTASVEMRDGRKSDLEDEGDIERAMDASADAIATAASKAWDATKTVGQEVGDKAEDAAGKTVDVSKDVGKKAVKGTKAVAGKTADKAEDAGDKIASGAKKVGKETKKLGKKIKDKVD